MSKSHRLIFSTLVIFLCLLVLSACKSDPAVGLPRHISQVGNGNNYQSNLSVPQGDPQSESDSDSSGEQTSDSSLRNYPLPTSSSYITVPPPVGIYSQPENQINFLMLGSDQRPDDSGFRTDAIILGTINLDSKEVNLVSIPRDLYVYVPGYAMYRINTALIRGGEDTLRMTYEYNFGVEIDNYMLINFDGFKDLIDILGGIDVYAATDMTDKHPTEGYDYKVNAGLNHMDGETALFYVRARTNSSDFDRSRRQQEVIKALVERIIKFDVIALIPDLFTQLKETIQTDLSLEDIISYASLISDFAQINDLSMYKIGAEQTTSWINPSTGANVLLPIQEAIQSIIKQSINFDE